MKKYLVSLANRAMVPLGAQPPKGGSIRNFDDLFAAQEFAKEEKDNWDRVVVLERARDGSLERIEHYLDGQYHRE